MSLLKTIIGTDHEVKTGTIILRLSQNYYKVRINGKIRRIKSAVNESLPIGAGVVITNTDNGLFIVGKETLKNRVQQEVIING